MKTPIAYLLLFSILAVFSNDAAAVSIRNKVDFRVTVSSISSDNPKSANCLYRDALQPSERNEAQPTLNLKRVDASSSEASVSDSHRACMDLLGRETLLNQTAGQNDVAEILNDMLCRPGARVGLTATGLPFDKWMLDGTQKRQQLVTGITVHGCLGDEIRLPDECSYPSASGAKVNVDQDKIIKALRRCRDAVNKIVNDQDLLDRWAKTLDKDGNPISGRNHQFN